MVKNIFYDKEKREQKEYFFSSSRKTFIAYLDSFFWLVKRR